MWEIFKYKAVKVQRKLKNMDQVMYIVKHYEFDVLKKEVEEFG